MASHWRPDKGFPGPWWLLPARCGQRPSPPPGSSELPADTALPPRSSQDKPDRLAGQLCGGSGDGRWPGPLKA
jgi:hypothetical protein